MSEPEAKEECKPLDMEALAKFGHSFTIILHVIPGKHDKDYENPNGPRSAFRSCAENQHDEVLEISNGARCTNHDEGLKTK